MQMLKIRKELWNWEIIKLKDKDSFSVNTDFIQQGYSKLLESLEYI